MTRPPTFSVIIPTLNEEKFLPNLLKSLVEQTERDFEVIVVDGKSKDKTVTIARSYQKKLPHLKIIEASHPSLPFQRNLGARSATGEWLIFVDADSVLLPYFMVRVGEYVETNHPSVFTTWFKPDSIQPKDAMFTLLADLYLEAALLFKQSHPPGHLSCIKRNIFESVGGYSESHHFYEDVDMGIRLRKRGIPFSMLRETLFVWSLRRYRREGTLKVIQQYVVSVLPVVFFGRAIKNMPGYIMGGHLYGGKKPIKKSLIKTYELKLKKLMKEIFE